MAVITLDNFTGVLDTDIDSRTPDSGPGTWVGPDSAVTATIGVDGSGHALTTGEVEDAYYRLTGLGVDDYRITIVATFTELDSGTWVSALARWSDGANGYEIALSGDGGLYLYRVDSYSFTQLAFGNVDVEVGVAQTLEVDVQGSDFNVYWQSELRLTASDGIYTSGDPGLNVTNATTGTPPTVTVDSFEIEDATGPAGEEEPSGTPDTFVLDHFTGDPDVDITGREPDGVPNPPGASCYSDGEWQKNPQSPGAASDINIPVGNPTAGRCCKVSNGGGGLASWNHYVIKDLSGIIGETYMVEAEFVVLDEDMAQGWCSILLLHDPQYEIGFELIYDVGGGSTLVALDRLDYRTGFLGGLYHRVATGYHPPVTTGQIIKLRACIDVDLDDVAHINCFVNNVPVFVATSFRDSSGWPGDADPIWPGICLSDSTTDGTGVAFNYIRVAISCDAPYPPSCDECEGPPDNPWPLEPPSCPPPEPEFSGERPHQIGQWRETIVPSNAIRSGLYRQAGGTLEFLTKWVMQNGIWREIIPDVGDTDPPCDPPDGKPPYYDPCENYPPLPEPPTEPLGPPPDRLFFAYDLPITTLGQIYTAAVNATGPWSTLNLSQAVARSGYIIGGIGGYSKYQSGGQYQRSLMTAWIDSHAAYMPAMVAEPFFYGQICMDDHAARERWNWPPSFSDQDITNEISYIAGYWKASYPGIRMGIRAREAQFSGGSYPSNIDFMVSQYRYWGLNRTPSAFVSEELGLANSRGHDILFSINFENGGLGPSSPYGGSSFSHRVMYEVGAGELQTAWLAMIVDTPHMHGIGGWKYSAEFLSHSGILDAHAVARNALAAIGPP